MSYDGFYSDLSSRGSSNEILNRAEQINKESEDIKEYIEGLESSVSFNSQASVDASQTSVLASQEAIRASEESTEALASILAATEVNARFILPSSLEPTQRDNGQPLVAGDQWTSAVDNRAYHRGGSVWLSPDGFESTVLDYVDGSPLVVARATQLISRGGGQLYSVKADKVFPYTLTGTYAADLPNLDTHQDLTLRQEVTAPTGASELVGFELSKLTRSIATAGDALNAYKVPLWGFAKFATGYVAGGNPATWDWAPAIARASLHLDAVTPAGGTIMLPVGAIGIGSQVTVNGLGKSVIGFGQRASELRAINGYQGDILVCTDSSYATISGFKIVGLGGSARGLYMPYRPSSGVTLQNTISDVQVETVAVGVLLENPVHCTVVGVRTTRDCTLYGLHSQFVAGVGAGQGGTNLRLIGGWFQAHAETGTSCRVNSNLSFSSIGTQFEHGRFGLLLRACAGATVISPLIEDCGLPMSLQGCTNLTVISPTLDSGTSPDTGSVIQPLIDIDGGSGIKILGITSIADNKAYIDYLIRFSNSAYGAYSSDVLIDGYKSEGSKGTLGNANVTNLRVFNNGVMQYGNAIMSELRVVPIVWAAPPSSPRVDEEFIANGTTWNPVPGGKAKVVYTGGGVYKKLFLYSEL